MKDTDKSELREQREQAVIMLFQKEFHESGEMQEQIELYCEYAEESVRSIAASLKNRIFDVFEKLGNIDSCLSEAISGWKLNRMSRMDLTILRLAVYEIFYDDSIPVKVSINEAVELAKKYGGESSPSFVNGVLAKVIKSNE